MTQLEQARKGIVTPEMEKVARKEGIPVDRLGEKVASGKVVLPRSRQRDLPRPCGIGEGLRTKVNANLGTSPVCSRVEEELEKLSTALEAGADTVMDLSTGPNLKECRGAILENSPVPVGTVPIYEAAVRAQEQHGAVVKMSVEDIFKVIEEQAQEGVDFMTVHCGVTLTALERLQKEGRVMGIVSRGGAILAGWMLFHGRENPLYQEFDRLLHIARKFDVTLSLGDGLRPGALADATDRAQIQELILLGELVERAWKAGVQVMVEGPGHVPLNQIEANIRLQKRICHGAPFYVLGPLVTDVAAGYDHIAAAIGGALAAACGADFLCYVTPAEHLGLPRKEDVREGVIAARIAAHAADLAKGIRGAWERDEAMSRARQELDWERQVELSLDPRKARQYREELNLPEATTCSMCGEFCALKLVREFLNFKSK